MKTDDICDYYADKGIKLTVRLLDNETVLIEGKAEALSFLGKMLLAHAEEKEDGRLISPNSSGQVFFTKESTLGVYIHRIPCDDEV
jgi:hypothetical protein